MQSTSRPPRPLRPAVRTRLLRRVVRRQHQGRRQSRAGAHRPRRPHQPRPPRGHRRRGRHRRRRRDPHPDPRPLPARRVRRPGDRPPAAGALRRRHRPSCRPTPTAVEKAQAAIEDIVAERGPRRGRLARRADRPGVPRRHRPGGDAVVPPALRHRRRRRPGRRRHRARPQGVRRPQAHRARARRRADDLLPVAVVAHPRVQGDVHHAPARRRSTPTSATSASRAPSLLVHSRFSTNTFPSWPLAHPYRFVAHNGEINTVQGNENWMRAREAMARQPAPAATSTGVPDLHAGRVRHGPLRRGARAARTSAGGRCHHAVLMMIPPAWENDATMDPAERAFFRFHASLMEPWDGPASVTFTDGTVIGAVLDRNGLRPSRYWVTDDDLVVMASEVGVIDVDPAKVVRKGRLQPGRMFLIDTAAGRIVDDAEIKAALAAEQPVPASGSTTGSSSSRTCPPASTSCSATTACCAASSCSATPTRSSRSSSRRWRRRRPSRSARWAPTRRSPCCRIGRACCSTTSASCSPRSPTRRSTRSARRSSRRWRPRSGPEANLLQPGPGELPPARPAVPDHRQRRAGQDRPRQRRRRRTPGCRPTLVKGLYRVAGGGLALERALAGDLLARCRRRSRPAPASSCSPTATPTHVEAPIPSLLLTAAVHHHLVRTKQRTMAGLIVECGDAREVHHMALLIGYGAGAINPYLAFESIEDLIADDGGHGSTASAGSTRPRRCATTSRRAARACSR